MCTRMSVHVHEPLRSALCTCRVMSLPASRTITASQSPQLVLRPLHAATPPT